MAHRKATTEVAYKRGQAVADAFMRIYGINDFNAVF